MLGKKILVAILVAYIWMPLVSHAQLPEWVLNPYANDRLAGAGCTSDTGIASVDRQVAMTIARSELTKQIETKMEVVDELVQSKSTDDAPVIEFKSVSRSIAKQSLKKSIASQIGIFDVNGKNQLCVLVALEKDEAQTMFRNIVKAVPVSLSIEEEDALFEAF